jgi:hypothetical protein
MNDIAKYFVLTLIAIAPTIYIFLELELMTNKLRFEYSTDYTGMGYLDFHFDILGYFWYNLIVKKSP